MAEEIINRIANSNLTTIDLEDFYPKGNRIVFDIKGWLYEELILREKDFRESVKNHDWSQYQDSYVALTCSSDAIIPSWAYLLLTVELTPFAKQVVVGDLALLETVIYQDIINQIDISDYQDKPIIIKGCANKPIPSSAYTLLIQKVKPVAKSVMFGEACSTVPLYKKKK
ncbi:DUF2480 family protein [Tenacibaculum sp. 47A_GOM-205m]|uniref:DUF2480 family protein n=1 Tax=Tenacibaculum sp. 47A_GOM-205m TaxID=1380384 RepID=UPI00048ADA97|nr:DUF2480 family protein [Tenacibaculum sp. 47A_GOM-205m]